MARFTIEYQEAEDRYDGYYALKDNKTGEIVFEDGGEPEDASLVRTYAPLVRLLNRVAEETAS